jgi:hypothetical protein
MQVRCSVLLSCFCTNHRALQLERTAPAHHLCFFSPTPGYDADHGITGEVVTQPQGGPGRRQRSASRAALRHRRLQQPFPRGSAAGPRLADSAGAASSGERANGHRPSARRHAPSQRLRLRQERTCGVAASLERAARCWTFRSRRHRQQRLRARARRAWSLSVLWQRSFMKGRNRRWASRLKAAVYHLISSASRRLHCRSTPWKVPKIYEDQNFIN